MIWNKPAIQGRAIGSLEHDGFVLIAKAVWRGFDFVGRFVDMFRLPEVKQQKQGTIQTDDNTDNGEDNIH